MTTPDETIRLKKQVGLALPLHVITRIEDLALVNGEDPGIQKRSLIMAGLKAEEEAHRRRTGETVGDTANRLRHGGV